MKCKFPAPILPPSPAPHSPPERAETRAGVHARGTRAHRRLPREHHHARLCAAPRLPRHTSLRRRRTWRPLISPAGFAVFQFGARS